MVLGKGTNKKLTFQKQLSYSQIESVPKTAIR
nr:MAG TPA: hypothetical protein [Caudoviricetes sp.]